MRARAISLLLGAALALVAITSPAAPAKGKVMLVSHTQLRDVEWTLHPEGDVVFTTSSDYLTDTRADRQTRITGWSVELDPTILYFFCTFDAYRPRVVALLNVSLPIGTLLVLTGRVSTGGPMDPFTYTFGLDDAPEARVSYMPDGSKAAIFILPADSDLLNALSFEIHSTDGEAQLLPFGSVVVDIGEILIAQAWDGSGYWNGNWSDDFVDPSIDRKTITSQPSPVYLTPYRVIAGAFDAIPRSLIIGSQDDPAAVTLHQLRRALAKRSPVLVIPRWRHADGTVDVDELYGSALFGRATKVGKFPHEAGPYWAWDLEFTETPVRM